MESFAPIMRTIALTLSISIKSSTSKLIPKTSSRLAPKDKCPTESQSGTSSALVSNVTDFVSTPNAALKASCTFAKISSVSLIGTFRLSD